MQYTNETNQPLELLLDCIKSLSKEERIERFSPEGEGFFLQEVVDASRVRTMEELLDSFSIDEEDPKHPKPETEELWMIYQWHPVKKQLISGDDLRNKLLFS